MTATLVTKESKAKYVLASSSSSRLLRRHVRVQLIDTDAIMGSRRQARVRQELLFFYFEQKL